METVCEAGVSPPLDPVNCTPPGEAVSGCVPGRIVKSKDEEALFLLLSTTWTESEYEPAAVGMPDNVPSPARVSPGGALLGPERKKNE